ncbi:MAG: alpha/beta fold hydrolase, partial [Alphaproteobacteria bacterium]
GMNAYQLAVSHPDFVQAIIPIAGSPATNPRTKTVLRNIMNTIALDNGWFGGRYDENPATGLATALMHLVPWWLTEEWFAANVSTPEQRLGFEKFWNDIFSVQAPQDARDVYYQLDAWANFNLGDTPGFDGDTRAALASVKAKTLLIGAKGDLLVRLDEMELARDTIPNARLVEIESPAGHLMVVGADTQASEIMNREIARFLSEIE